MHPRGQLDSERAQPVLGAVRLQRPGPDDDSKRHIRLIKCDPKTSVSTHLREHHVLDSYCEDHPHLPGRSLRLQKGRGAGGPLHQQQGAPHILN